MTETQIAFGNQHISRVKLVFKPCRNAVIASEIGPCERVNGQKSAVFQERLPPRSSVQAIFTTKRSWILTNLQGGKRS